MAAIRRTADRLFTRLTCYLVAYSFAVGFGLGARAMTCTFAARLRSSQTQSSLILSPTFSVPMVWIISLSKPP